MSTKRKQSPTDADAAESERPLKKSRTKDKTLPEPSIVSPPNREPVSVIYISRNHNIRFANGVLLLQAVLYLNTVEKHFASRPNLFNDFLCTLRAFQSNKLVFGVVLWTK